MKRFIINLVCSLIGGLILSWLFPILTGFDIGILKPTAFFMLWYILSTISEWVAEHSPK